MGLLVLIFFKGYNLIIPLLYMEKEQAPEEPIRFQSA